jgi:hypothetical protein
MGEATGGAALTGGCQCGAVRYALSARPSHASVCYCRMCQKASGQPFMAFARVRRDELTWTQGRPAIFKSSDVAERGFCRDCGTPLTYRFLASGNISVTACSLDDPEAVRPERQYGVESKLSWLSTLDSLPQNTTADWMRKSNIAQIESRQHPDHDEAAKR